MGHQDPRVPLGDCLRISDEAYEGLPDDLGSLLDWWKDERLAPTLDESVLISPKSSPATATKD